MNFIELVGKMQKSEGNYRRKFGDVFISLPNIEKLSSLLRDCDDFHSILITPFFLSENNDNLYELHYYEFVIEISDVEKSHYVDYPTENLLDQEIVENIKPKAVISIGDKTFIYEALNAYLQAMRNMRFSSDRKAIESLQGAKLCFQIY